MQKTIRFYYTFLVRYSHVKIVICFYISYSASAIIFNMAIASELDVIDSNSVKKALSIF